MAFVRTNSSLKDFAQSSQISFTSATATTFEHTKKLRTPMVPFVPGMKSPSAAQAEHLLFQVLNQLSQNLCSVYPSDTNSFL
jgi:hypothetical protein